MTVPGGGHENIGAEQKQNGSHRATMLAQGFAGLNRRLDAGKFGAAGSGHSRYSNKDLMTDR
jgi:hypothetical protein